MSETEEWWWTWPSLEGSFGPFVAREEAIADARTRAREARERLNFGPYEDCLVWRVTDYETVKI